MLMEGPVRGRVGFVGEPTGEVEVLVVTRAIGPGIWLAWFALLESPRLIAVVGARGAEGLKYISCRDGDETVIWT